jgi:hypothetical protein
MPGQIKRGFMKFDGCVRAILVGFLAICMSVCSVAQGVQKTHELGVRGSQFTLDGRPVFLLGCSYYGALGGDEKTWRADLDDMQKAGINWIRVWATWSAFGRNVSAVDGKTGEPRGEFMEKLKQLVAECDRRGMVVDVSLSRGNGVAGPGGLKSIDAHLRAAQ